MQFQKEINQMLQAGVLLPVHEATPADQQFCSHRKERQPQTSQAENLP